MSSIVINYMISRIHDGQHLFLTGGAGTGKTYTTKEFLKVCDQENISVLQCGTTGISALQLTQGKSLHSTLGLGIDYPNDENIVKKAVYRHNDHGIRETFKTQKNRQIIHDACHAKVLLIDEISMCSAYLLDSVDLSLRIYRKCNEPFGGLCLLAVGDFLQLPPVYTGKGDVPLEQKLFAFESKIWNAVRPDVILLHGSKRQVDQDFMNLLSKIRLGKPLSRNEKDSLEFRDVKRFPEMPENENANSLYIAHRRKKILDINQSFLKKLIESKNTQYTYTFPLVSAGKGRKKNAASVALEELTSTVRENLYLSKKEDQTFVIGQRVMLISNYEEYVNGDTGTVVEFVSMNDPKVYAKKVQLFWDKNACNTPKHTTKNESGEMLKSLKGCRKDVFPVVRFDRTKSEYIVGTFRFSREVVSTGASANVSLDCIPLICSFGITVHKVQGCTISVPLNFDCQDVDWQQSIFYVGLSRATELPNVYLKDYRGRFTCNQKCKHYYEVGHVEPFPETTLQECAEKGYFKWIPSTYRLHYIPNERSSGLGPKFVADAIEKIREEQSQSNGYDEKELIEQDIQTSIQGCTEYLEGSGDHVLKVVDPVLEYVYDSFPQKRKQLFECMDDFKRRKIQEE